MADDELDEIMRSNARPQFLSNISARRDVMDTSCKIQREKAENLSAAKIIARQAQEESAARQQQQRHRHHRRQRRHSDDDDDDDSGDHSSDDSGGGGSDNKSSRHKASLATQARPSSSSSSSSTATSWSQPQQSAPSWSTPHVYGQAVGASATTPAPATAVPPPPQAPTISSNGLFSLSAITPSPTFHTPLSTPSVGAAPSTTHIGGTAAWAAAAAASTAPSVTSSSSSYPASRAQTGTPGYLENNFWTREPNVVAPSAASAAATVQNPTPPTESSSSASGRDGKDSSRGDAQRRSETGTKKDEKARKEDKKKKKKSKPKKASIDDWDGDESETSSGSSSSGNERLDNRDSRDTHRRDGSKKEAAHRGGDTDRGGSRSDTDDFDDNENGNHRHSGSRGRGHTRGRESDRRGSGTSGSVSTSPPPLLTERHDEQGAGRDKKGGSEAKSPEKRKDADVSLGKRSDEYKEKRNDTSPKSGRGTPLVRKRDVSPKDKRGVSPEGKRRLSLSPGEDRGKDRRGSPDRRGGGNDRDTTKDHHDKKSSDGVVNVRDGRISPGREEKTPARDSDTGPQKSRPTDSKGTDRSSASSSSSPPLPPDNGKEKKPLSKEGGDERNKSGDEDDDDDDDSGLPPPLITATDNEDDGSDQSASENEDDDKKKKKSQERHASSDACPDPKIKKEKEKDEAKKTDTHATTSLPIEATKKHDHAGSLYSSSSSSRVTKRVEKEEEEEVKTEATDKKDSKEVRSDKGIESSHTTTCRESKSPLVVPAISSSNISPVQISAAAPPSSPSLSVQTVFLSSTALSAVHHVEVPAKASSILPGATAVPSVPSPPALSVPLTIEQSAPQDSTVHSLTDALRSSPQTGAPPSFGAHTVQSSLPSALPSVAMGAQHMSTQHMSAQLMGSQHMEELAVASHVTAGEDRLSGDIQPHAFAPIDGSSATHYCAPRDGSGNGALHGESHDRLEILRSDTVTDRPATLAGDTPYATVYIPPPVDPVAERREDRLARRVALRERSALSPPFLYTRPAPSVLDTLPAGTPPATLHLGAVAPPDRQENHASNAATTTTAAYPDTGYTKMQPVPVVVQTASPPFAARVDIRDGKLGRVGADNNGADGDDDDDDDDSAVSVDCSQYTVPSYHPQLPSVAPLPPFFIRREARIWGLSDSEIRPSTQSQPQQEQAFSLDPSSVTADPYRQSRSDPNRQSRDRPPFSALDFARRQFSSGNFPETVNNTSWQFEPNDDDENDDEDEEEEEGHDSETTGGVPATGTQLNPPVFESEQATVPQSLYSDLEQRTYLGEPSHDSAVLSHSRDSAGAQGDRSHHSRDGLYYHEEAQPQQPFQFDGEQFVDTAHAVLQQHVPQHETASFLQPAPAQTLMQAEHPSLSHGVASLDQDYNYNNNNNHVPQRQAYLHPAHLQHQQQQQQQQPPPSRPQVNVQPRMSAVSSTTAGMPSRSGVSSHRAPVVVPVRTDVPIPQPERVPSQADRVPSQRVVQPVRFVQPAAVQNPAPPVHRATMSSAESEKQKIQHQLLQQQQAKAEEEKRQKLQAEQEEQKRRAQQKREEEEKEERAWLEKRQRQEEELSARLDAEEEEKARRRQHPSSSSSDKKKQDREDRKDSDDDDDEEEEEEEEDDEEAKQWKEQQLMRAHAHLHMTLNRRILTLTGETQETMMLLSQMNLSQKQDYLQQVERRVRDNTAIGSFESGIGILAKGAALVTNVITGKPPASTNNGGGGGGGSGGAGSSDQPKIIARLGGPQAIYYAARAQKELDEANATLTGVAPSFLSNVMATAEQPMFALALRATHFMVEDAVVAAGAETLAAGMRRTKKQEAAVLTRRGTTSGHNLLTDKEQRRRDMFDARRALGDEYDNDDDDDEATRRRRRKSDRRYNDRSGGGGGSGGAGGSKGDLSRRPHRRSSSRRRSQSPSSSQSPSRDRSRKGGSGSDSSYSSRSRSDSRSSTSERSSRSRSRSRSQRRGVSDSRSCSRRRRRSRSLSRVSRSSTLSSANRQRGRTRTVDDQKEPGAEEEEEEDEEVVGPIPTAGRARQSQQQQPVLQYRNVGVPSTSYSTAKPAAKRATRPVDRGGGATDISLRASQNATAHLTGAGRTVQGSTVGRVVQGSAVGRGVTVSARGRESKNAIGQRDVKSRVPATTTTASATSKTAAANRSSQQNPTGTVPKRKTAPVSSGNSTTKVTKPTTKSRGVPPLPRH